jgi:spore maturation protein CgeB
MGDTQVIVVGADWHGEWAKDVYLAFRASGADAEIIYTNTLFGGMGSSKVAAKARVEIIKQFFRQHTPSLFDFVREVRRWMSERTVLKKIASFHKPGHKLLVLFIWTPPGVSLLKALRTNKEVALVLWQGEAPSRNAQWARSFPYFHHIFSVDEEWLPLFDKEIQRKTTYLPLSSSSTTHFPLPKEAQDQRFISDIAFVGHYRPERAEKLSALKDNNLKIYGYWWEAGVGQFPWLQEKYCGPVSDKDANQVFNGGKIQIGRLSTPIAYGNTITQRVFDAALAGSFQLSEYSLAIEKIFGKSVVMFRDGKELKKLADYYLLHAGERQRLAAQAHAIALKDHTYASRIKTIMKISDPRR